MNWHDWSTLPVSEFLLIKRVGVSVVCISNSNFSTERAIRSSSKIGVGIPDDAIVGVINVRRRMAAKGCKIRNVLVVSLGASMKYDPRFSLVILAYAMCCSGINFGRFVSTKCT